MPGGNSSQIGNKTTQKPKQGNTVQTLLAAKKDSNSSGSSSSKPQAKSQKRNHSELSSESDHSMDLTGMINLQKDIDEIKLNLQGLTKREDLDRATKDLVTTSDLDIMVTAIVRKLLQQFESSMDKKVHAKVTQLKTEMQEQIDALAVENSDLKRQVEQLKNTSAKTKQELHENAKLVRDAVISSNYNEQYSRKNNIKVMNFPRKEKQNLRADFIATVKKDLNVELEDRDVVAIHRIPSEKPGHKPVIVRLFNSDIKRSVMRERKNLTNNVRFVDDVTRKNLELIKKLDETEQFESVWYYNCGIYGRTEDGLQLKFGLFDDIQLRLRQGR